MIKPAKDTHFSQFLDKISFYLDTYTAYIFLFKINNEKIRKRYGIYLS